LNESGGLWFGWSGEVTDAVPVKVHILEQDEISFATVPLSAHDYRGYYRGYANRVLWPLFHTQLHRVEFQRQDLLAYERVNKQLARRLTSLLKAEDIIWAHDYHLIPLASELRRLKVHQPIGFFLRSRPMRFCEPCLGMRIYCAGSAPTIS
ncbi:MAG: trehalose-6-phosphate synthase, partial [Gammaproteobacteria bacterium]